jgi:hypothetical protein
MRANENSFSKEHIQMNNIPAFPLSTSSGSNTEVNGMTLRDYFAARALQNFRDQIGSQSDQEWFDLMAEGAYRLADEMMKAREA